MEQLRVCVIGTGSISDMHLASYANNLHAVLYGVYDFSKERAEEKARKYGIEKVYDSLEAVFDDPHVDAVSICTWNNTHAEISIGALKSGKHVLVEKPLSMTVEEAVMVEEAARKSTKTFQVGFVRRFATNTRVLKSFIDQGKLGEIYYAKASCLRRLGNPGGWFADQARSGGGPLIDLGVHIIDICWYLMGRPKVKSISGNTYRQLGNRGNVGNLSFYKAADYDQGKNTVEDLANALITFENGASLLVDVSFTLHAKKDEIQVKLFGTKGGAELEPELVLISEENNTILNIHPQMDHLSFDFSNAFQNEIDSFVESCLSGIEPVAPVADGVEIMKILAGIYEAAEKKCEVRF
ncbi:Gfo/Idh/MocA family oxidoreductase [Bacillus salipaludis]|uniref:Gfo/Idh/MocA family oxidoreductase n=1 Tax=Bacillus salipaludis TaxID=2547811 RepID=A0A4R5VT36_9BACI|nr:Gfo/Idh/MocA family oxidoreductase [Bacillus salipaludis]MDQ6600496.1 Gfo/Idh/MocA family oxidoreductase [Bacillus salipaludis]TDK62112.1 Gfo/Idh/MocA family oxidoreductase [Bacillus salipaludis]